MHEKHLRIVPGHIERHRKQTGGCRGSGDGDWGVTANGYGLPLWRDENVLKREQGELHNDATILKKNH